MIATDGEKHECEVQKETNRKQAKRDWLMLCGTQAAYWSVCTMQSSFLVSFLTSNGYSNVTTANIVLLTSIVNLASQPIWGFVADSKLGLRRVILCCLGVSIPLFILMPAAVVSLPFTVLLNVMYGMFNHPMQGLTDAITNITATRNSYVVYGVTRGCGSLAAALSSLFIGRLLDITGVEALFLINAGLCAFAFVLMWLFRGVSYGMPKVSLAKNVDEPVTLQLAARVLMKNRRYLFLVVSTVLMNTAGRLTSLYVPILINQFGGTSSDLGTSLFLNCILMAPCMVLHSRLIRRGYSNAITYITSGVFAALRLICMYFAQNLATLVGVQILQSFAYGLMMPSTVQAISEVSPVKLRSTAISLAIAVQIVLSTLIGNNLGSWVASRYGTGVAFMGCAILTLLGIVFYIPVISGKKQEAEEV